VLLFELYINDNSAQTWVFRQHCLLYYNT